MIDYKKYEPRPYAFVWHEELSSKKFFFVCFVGYSSIYHTWYKVYLLETYFQHNLSRFWYTFWKSCFNTIYSVSGMYTIWRYKNTIQSICIIPIYQLQNSSRKIIGSNNAAIPTGPSLSWEIPAFDKARRGGVVNC